MSSRCDVDGVPRAPPVRTEAPPRRRDVASLRPGELSRKRPHGINRPEFPRIGAKCHGSRRQKNANSSVFRLYAGGTARAMSALHAPETGQFAWAPPDQVLLGKFVEGS